jgi:hypothetical protein
MMGLFRLPALFFGAFGATAWITQLDQMFLTDGKGHFDLLPQKLPFHFTFQHQLWCIITRAGTGQLSHNLRRQGRSLFGFAASSRHSSRFLPRW